MDSRDFAIVSQKNFHHRDTKGTENNFLEACERRESTSGKVLRNNARCAAERMTDDGNTHTLR
jgi:hypothetical protein